MPCTLVQWKAATRPAASVALDEDEAGRVEPRLAPSARAGRRAVIRPCSGWRANAARVDREPGLLVPSRARRPAPRSPSGRLTGASGGASAPSGRRICQSSRTLVKPSAAAKARAASRCPCAQSAADRPRPRSPARRRGRARPRGGGPPGGRRPRRSPARPARRCRGGRSRRAAPGRAPGGARGSAPSSSAAEPLRTCSRTCSESGATPSATVAASASAATAASLCVVEPGHGVHLHVRHSITGGPTAPGHRSPRGHGLLREPFPPSARGHSLPRPGQTARYLAHQMSREPHDHLTKATPDRCPGRGPRRRHRRGRHQRHVQLPTPGTRRSTSRSCPSTTSTGTSRRPAGPAGAS